MDPNSESSRSYTPDLVILSGLGNGCCPENQEPSKGEGLVAKSRVKTLQKWSGPVAASGESPRPWALSFTHRATKRCVDRHGRSFLVFLQEASKKMFLDVRDLVFFRSGHHPVGEGTYDVLCVLILLGSWTARCIDGFQRILGLLSADWQDLL